MNNKVKDFRSHVKKINEEKKRWEKQVKRAKEIEYLGGYFYEALGGEMFSMFIYDKKTKRVFAGTLKKSSYSKKDILDRKYLEEKEE